MAIKKDTPAEKQDPTRVPDEALKKGPEPGKVVKAGSKDENAEAAAKIAESINPMKGKPGERGCGQCEYFCPIPNNPHGEGRCCYEPPKVQTLMKIDSLTGNPITHITALWPRVNKSSWCGKFQHATNKTGITN